MPGRRKGDWRCRWVVSFMLHSKLGGRAPDIVWVGGWLGTNADLDAWIKRTCLPLSAIKCQLSSVIVLIELPFPVTPVYMEQGRNNYTALECRRKWVMRIHQFSFRDYCTLKNITLQLLIFYRCVSNVVATWISTNICTRDSKTQSAF